MDHSRLETIKKWLVERPEDALVRHALAMEHARLGDVSAALACWQELRIQQADYLPLYYPAAKLAMENDNEGLSRELVQHGITIARNQQDKKTEAELISLQQQLDE